MASRMASSATAKTSAAQRRMSSKLRTPGFGALPALRAALQDRERTTTNEDVSVSEVAAEALRRIER